ncbi:MAG: stage III sporulation protein AE [bacterium]
MENILEALDIQQYDTIIGQNINNNFNNSIELGFSFSDIVRVLLNPTSMGEINNIGNFDIANFFLNIIFEKIYINSALIKNVIIIALLSAFIKVITESFNNKGISEIAFYTSYIGVAVILINSFDIMLSILQTAITSISNIINAIMPLMASLLIMSGGSVSSAIFTSFILMALSFLSFFMRNVFIPVISGLIVLTIVNYITPKEILDRLIEFLIWLLKTMLKALALGLTVIVSIQKISAPALNSLANKTAKSMITLVPIVGDAMNGAIDSVMYFVGAIQGGVGAGILIIILICSIMPILNLVAFIIIYKVVAVLIEPVSDSRITSCIDDLGEYTKLILSALVVYIFLFVFFILLILSNF